MTVNREKRIGLTDDCELKSFPTMNIPDPTGVTIDKILNLPYGTIVNVGIKGEEGFYTGLVIHSTLIFGMVTQRADGNAIFHSGLYFGRNFIPGIISELGGNLAFVPGIFVGGEFVPGVGSSTHFGAGKDSSFFPGIFSPAENIEAFAWQLKSSNAFAGYYDSPMRDGFIPGVMSESGFQPGDYKRKYLGAMQSAAMLERKPIAGGGSKQQWCTCGGKNLDISNAFGRIGALGGVGAGGVLIALGCDIITAGACAIPQAVTFLGASAAVGGATFAGIGVIFDYASCPEPTKPGAVTIVNATAANPGNNDQTPASPTNNNQAPANPSNNDQTPANPTNNNQVPANPSNNDQTPANPTNNNQAPANTSNSSQPVDFTGESGQINFEMDENGNITMNAGSDGYCLQVSNVVPPEDPPQSGGDNQDVPEDAETQIAHIPSALQSLISVYLPAEKCFSRRIDDVAFYDPDAPSSITGSHLIYDSNSNLIQVSGVDTVQTNGGTVIIASPVTVDPAHID